MPLFTLCVSQMVERTASFEVDAPDAEAALAFGQNYLRGNTATLDFVDGDDPGPARICAVQDDQGDTVLEPDA